MQVEAGSRRAARSIFGVSSVILASICFAGSGLAENPVILGTGKTSVEVDYRALESLPARPSIADHYRAAYGKWGYGPVPAAFRRSGHVHVPVSRDPNVAAPSRPAALPPPQRSPVRSDDPDLPIPAPDETEAEPQPPATDNTSGQVASESDKARPASTETLSTSQPTVARPQPDEPQNRDTSNATVPTPQPADVAPEQPREQVVAAAVVPDQSTTPVAPPNLAAPAISVISTVAGETVRILFAVGEAKFADTSSEALERMVNAAREDEATRIQLHAFASDPDENDNRARRLSLTRALAVRSYLIEAGASSTQMDVRALGARAGSGPPDRVRCTDPETLSHENRTPQMPPAQANPARPAMTGPTRFFNAYRRLPGGRCHGIGIAVRRPCTKPSWRIRH